MDEQATTPATPGDEQRPTAALVSAVHPRDQPLWKYLGKKLGLKPGTRMHVREQGPEYFISAGLEDTLLFPVDHPTLPRQERYTWAEDPDAPTIMLGTLVPSARPKPKKDAADGTP